MKIILNLMVLLMLLGCAKKYDVPVINNFSQKSFSISSNNLNAILSVKKLENGYKFGLFDTFGVPIARRIFINSSFKNDGFLNKNEDYNLLFIEILALIKDDKKQANISINEDDFLIKALDDISF